MTGIESAFIAFMSGFNAFGYLDKECNTSKAKEKSITDTKQVYNKNDVFMIVRKPMSNIKVSTE